jgi:hypothetical protein
MILGDFSGGCLVSKQDLGKSLRIIADRRHNVRNPNWIESASAEFVELAQRFSSALGAP